LLEEIPKGYRDGKSDDMSLYGSGCHQFCLSAHDTKYCNPIGKGVQAEVSMLYFRLGPDRLILF